MKKDQLERTYLRDHNINHQVGYSIRLQHSDDSILKEESGSNPSTFTKTTVIL